MDRYPLDGIRITDFTWAWAGPYSTGLLAFMGAEVIKVESNHRVDHSRRFSFSTGQTFQGVNQSSAFNNLNLNKMSISLNLTHPGAVALAKKLVSISDAVTVNMRPGVIDKLGLGYEELRKIKPDIVMVASSACGTVGPERQYVGYAPNFGGLGGLLYVSGYQDGPPATITGSVDLRSATTMAFAIMAALYHRARTGEGQYVDLASRETISVILGEMLMDYTMNGRVRQRQDNRDDMMVPHNCYPCRGKDKWVSIAVGSEEEWRSLCRALGDPEWSREQRFADAYLRWQNQEELDRLIGAWTIERTNYQVMETLQQSGVAAAPSFSAEELYHDPHVRERQVFTEVVHPDLGKQIVTGAPWKLSGLNTRPQQPSPRLGEHNDYVFGELLGLPAGEVARLKKEGVIN